MFVLSTFSNFSGFVVLAGKALVDTGAQHGVIGLPSYRALVAKLAEQGLKPKQIETLNVAAAGIGGQTKLLLSAETPTAIAGCSGIVTVHAIEQDMPMLLLDPIRKASQQGSIGINSHSTCINIFLSIYIYVYMFT